MKLDRNINGTGRGKYGLVNNRKLLEVISPARAEGDDNDASMVKLRLAFRVRDAIELLEEAGILDWGVAGTEGEFFVIKLRDAYAGGALHTYASYAVRDGQVEYGRDVMELAKRSGEFHPNCKKPD
ncbi:hypothetical protein ABIE89_006481 [Bradyrhizobium niftali]|uniref:hypothetical protein n=1 Tax=Bradyrhizobium niftali TaxID=2560055 RepID=UPI0038377712